MQENAPLAHLKPIILKTHQLSLQYKVQQSLKNKKGDKPLHHIQKIQTQEYCFQCKHCSLQKVKSTNIYVPVYPYLQRRLFHITKYVKYLYSHRNTEVYPLKSIWWLKLECLYKQCNFLEKLKFSQ